MYIVLLLFPIAYQAVLGNDIDIVPVNFYVFDIGIELNIIDI